MKDCKDCEYFEGYDYSDGTPYCSNDGGYERCPFNDMSNVKKNGIKIEIDSGFMHDYILHTMKNTIEGQAYQVASSEIKSLITNEVKDFVLDEIKSQVGSFVSDAISDFISSINNSLLSVNNRTKSAQSLMSAYKLSCFLSRLNRQKKQISTSADKTK